MHTVFAYRGAPNDVVVFACIVEAARNTAFWQCLHKILGILGILGSFLLLKDISLTTGPDRYSAGSQEPFLRPPEPITERTRIGPG
jgi:hypothetical protein